MNTRLALACRRFAGAGVAAAILSGSFAMAPSAHATTTAASGTVTGFSPSYGKVGTTVTVDVSGFDSTQPATVRFGSSTPQPVASTDWTSPDEFRVSVPSDATTGRIRVAQTAPTSVTAKSQDPFVVTLPASATISSSPHTVTWPHPVAVTARLTDAGGAVAGHWAHLQARSRGSAKWRTLKAVRVRRTDSHGRVTFRVVPTAAVSYRVRFPATHADTAATTRPSALTTVVSGVRLHVAKTIPQLTSVPVTGTAGPLPYGTVRLQVAHGGRWHTLVTPRVRHHRFSATVDFSQLGRVRLRAVRPGDRVRRTGISATAVAQVVHRSLSQGDSGPDVKALQRRLARLHYDIGAVNGKYGFDTFHAVTAFQKVQGLSDDGSVGLKTWAALAHPKRLHLRHPLSGVTAVEVNLAKQVVMIAKNGHIWRIIDSSTAGGYSYTDSAGQTEKAVTPTGHFSIQYKQEGWQHSSLGYLYRPAYFTDTGYAIHGETAVPPYPASHGCVRITVPAMDRYYHTFYVGESVWIYGNPPPGHE